MAHETQTVTEKQQTTEHIKTQTRTIKVIHKPFFSYDLQFEYEKLLCKQYF